MTNRGSRSRVPEARGPVRQARGPVQRWGTFVRRYGWRAYALPILSIITVATLVQGLPASAERHPVAHHAAGAAVQIEGDGPAEEAFTRGSTPQAVVIELASDEHTCAQNTYGRHVIVSISAQHLWACRDHRQVLQTPVTTGASARGDGTPLGSWQVVGRERNRYLVGPGYRDYVHYWVPFNGDFGLHDAPWEKTGYGSKDYPTKGSHGCVHVPRAEMAFLYKWTRVGSTVVTIEA